ncbi:hypothetical protein, partial [Corynebacterium sp.]|uniref:hypothetical protein n=1 Tax=Corynebacterium sp. TaxID=1720 RepID=UPI0026DAE2C8
MESTRAFLIPEVRMMWVARGFAGLTTQVCPCAGKLRDYIGVGCENCGGIWAKNGRKWTIYPRTFIFWRIFPRTFELAPESWTGLILIGYGC